MFVVRRPQRGKSSTAPRRPATAETALKKSALSTSSREFAAEARSSLEALLRQQAKRTGGTGSETGGTVDPQSEMGGGGKAGSAAGSVGLLAKLRGTGFRQSVQWVHGREPAAPWTYRRK
ncbi:unnamed protein product [Ascophyllum nodosum]